MASKLFQVELDGSLYNQTHSTVEYMPLINAPIKENATEKFENLSVS
jgi:hypothetical protein